MEKKRYFSCNSNSFTEEHNDIMDELLWGYCYFTDYNHIDYSCGYYYPKTKEGLKILEHLSNCDLIEEVEVE